jgi:hypothetical protein
MTTCAKDLNVHVVHGANEKCDCGFTESGWKPANDGIKRLIPKHSPVEPSPSVEATPSGEANASKANEDLKARQGSVVE